VNKPLLPKEDKNENKRENENGKEAFRRNSLLHIKISSGTTRQNLKLLYPRWELNFMSFINS